MSKTQANITEITPEWLRMPYQPPNGLVRRLWFFLLQLPVRLLIWVALHPRLERPGDLSQQEVDRVYDRRARSYDVVHHFTTRGQDTSWRRLAGWTAAVIEKSDIQVLDLCTGTGLAVAEIQSVLQLSNKSARITGIDYNEKMLTRARARITSATPEGVSVSFLRADAKHLVGSAASKNELAKFPPMTFDLVTQIFGIGGIDDPGKVFEQTLALLKGGGRYLLVDMHRPIQLLPGEIPFFGWWFVSPEFEAYTYEYTTKPLALARLWAWRDTTKDFYQLPNVCLQDNGTYWGFRILWRSVQSERWWLSLPVMPTCYLLVEKVKITKAEFEKRQKLK